MGSTGQELALFLTGTVFSIYISLLMLRFLLALVRADFYNPVSQAIVRLTNPLLVPLRRIVPPLGKADTAALLLMWVLQLLELWLKTLIVGQPVPMAALLVVSVFELAKLAIWVYIIALFAQAILSWVAPHGGHGNPVAAILYYLTEPLLRPIRRLLPDTGMIDFSPMAAMIGLYVLLILVNGLMRSVLGLL